MPSRAFDDSFPFTPHVEQFPTIQYFPCIVAAYCPTRSQIVASNHLAPPTYSPFTHPSAQYLPFRPKSTPGCAHTITLHTTTFFPLSQRHTTQYTRTCFSSKTGTVILLSRQHFCDCIPIRNNIAREEHQCQEPKENDWVGRGRRWRRLGKPHAAMSAHGCTRDNLTTVPFALTINILLLNI